MGRLLRAFDLEETLRARLAGGMPTLTTCAGLILLSSAITDGRSDQVFTSTLDIAVRRNGWGSQVDSFEEDVEFPDLGEPPFHAVFIRAPRIEHVGERVEVLASLSGEPVAIGQGPHIGLTFHPEMTDDDRVHRLFLERLGSSCSESAA
jgi:pyridoxal 5'-phosphate synthase pdxT subunit